MDVLNNGEVILNCSIGQLPDMNHVSYIFTHNIAGNGARATTNSITEVQKTVKLTLASPLCTLCLAMRLEAIHNLVEELLQVSAIYNV